MPAVTVLAAVVDVRGVVLVGAAAFVYTSGVRRARAAAGRGRIVHRRQVLAAGAGFVAAGVAVASPLDAAADRSLTAHMVQHVLLLSAAGPLLALGGCLPAVAWAVPRGLRRRTLAVWRSAVRSQSAHWWGWVGGAIVAQATVMWTWHAPALYDAALSSEAVHDLEHLCFIASSALLWWSLAGGRSWRRGGATLATFVAALPGTALGAAMLLAPRPWYPAYVHGSGAAALGRALADQQMAGVVMWAFAGLTYVVGAAVLFGTWIAATADDEPPVVVPAWTGLVPREEVRGAVPPRPLV